MKPVIVKFNDGTFGIRKGFFRYRYKDLQSSDFWWPKDHSYYKDCRGNFETVIKQYKNMRDIGEVYMKSNVIEHHDALEGIQ